MRPYLVKPPKVYRWLFPEALFRVAGEEKTVYLTFDDGPHPEATPFVLDVLKKHDVKSTFFLLGKNAKANPELVERIKGEGHTIGNHGMNHLSGWSVGLDEYLKDVEEGKQLVGSTLFRPPYGKLTLSQYRKLRTTEQIVLWDVISGDFDTNIGPKEVLSNVVNNVKGGSVIVMHDSTKAFNNLKLSLNEIIQQLSEKGYRFKPLQVR